MKAELAITGRVESLHLKPGDRILVTLDDPRHAPEAQIDALREMLAEKFPDHEIIILGGIRVTTGTAA